MVENLSLLVPVCAALLVLVDRLVLVLRVREDLPGLALFVRSNAGAPDRLLEGLSSSTGLAASLCLAVASSPENAHGVTLRAALALQRVRLTARLWLLDLCGVALICAASVAPAQAPRAVPALLGVIGVRLALTRWGVVRLATGEAVACTLVALRSDGSSKNVGNVLSTEVSDGI